MRTALLTLACITSLAAALAAQSFNMDIGRITAGAPGGGNPAPVFGGAAGRPGLWNPIAELTTGPFALADVNHNATGVTVTRNTFAGATYGYNNGLTTGYFQSLMDDGQTGGPGETRSYTFTGLAPGTYTVFTYAWSPQNAGWMTDVTVVGSSSPNPQTVGGALPALNTFALGTTHAVHVVTIAAGMPLTIEATVAAGYSILNGFQIVDGYGLTLAQAAANTPLLVANSYGHPGDFYANLFTLAPGAFPNGPFFGLDMTVAEAEALLALGPPFFGVLDAAGAASFTVPGIIPSGVTLYGVGVGFDPTAPALYATAPFTYTTL